MGRWKTENSKDRIRNSKQYTFKNKKKAQQSKFKKWIETGVTVCDRTVRNKGYV